MKGFILAAGLGTRLKPWTDHHPKALVPVGGTPMLEHVVNKMLSFGIHDITVNVFHFAHQIKDLIKEKNWNINISEEKHGALETGGAILNARKFLESDDEPILVHNVDIFSDVSFAQLSDRFSDRGGEAMLYVSNRESSRKLIFDEDFKLIGWHSLRNDEYKPSEFEPIIKDLNGSVNERAFNGIYIISPNFIREMAGRGWSGKFSVIDFMLATLSDIRFYGEELQGSEVIDIGKPDSLDRANKRYL